MPVSKNGKLRYTREQLEVARQVSALDYARSRGYPLVGGGNRFTMADHDSMVFTGDGRWNWNSRQFSGRALEFCMHYEDMTMPEAVILLAEGPEALQADLAEASRIASQPALSASRTPPQAFSQPQAPAVQQAAPPPWLHPSEPPEPAPKPPFELPLRAENDRRVYAYLCKERSIAPEVVQDMIQQGVLYESVAQRKDGTVVRLKNGNEVHNACFVNYDADGKPCGAYQRSLYDGGKPFKLDVTSSNKDYGWQLGGQVAGSVVVFEASIDAASYASFCAQSGDQYPDLLALGGLNAKPIETYLDAHPETQSVMLALDMDEAGRSATSRFAELLQKRGISVYDISEGSITHGKDWNEELKWYAQEQATPIQAAPEPAAAPQAAPAAAQESNQSTPKAEQPPKENFDQLLRESLQHVAATMAHYQRYGDSPDAPPPPRIEDYSPAIKAYKEQVRAEEAALNDLAAEKPHETTPLAADTPQPAVSPAPAPAAAQAPAPRPAAPRPIANARPVTAAPQPAVSPAAAPAVAQAPAPRPAAPRPIANARPAAAAPQPAVPPAAAPAVAQAPAPRPAAPRPMANAKPVAAAPQPAVPPAAAPAVAQASRPAAPRPLANARPVAAAPQPAVPSTAAPAAAQAPAASPPLDAERQYLLACVQYFRRYGDAIERGEAGLPPMPRVEDYTASQQAAQTPTEPKPAAPVQAAPAAAPQPAQPEHQPKEGFQLPPKAENNKQLWACLCKQKGLAHEVVRTMIQSGALYESLDSDGGHSACFVRYDAAKPCGASKMNLSTGADQEVTGSDKAHGWQLDGAAPEGVMVFQTPLDAASFASFYGQGATPRPDFLALNGLDFEPLNCYLDTHPEVRYVELALPTDELGRAASHRFTALLQKRGIRAYELSEGNITHGKTWNEELQARRKPEPEASRSFFQGAERNSLPDRSSPDTFCVCRLKDVDRVQRVLGGGRVKPRHYRPIHRDLLRPGDTPQAILSRLATGQPSSWRRLPMVNSDVLILHQGGKDSAYLYTPQGLQERPDLLAAELQDPAPAPQMDEMEM